MGRVAQTPLAAVGLLTPAPRSAATTAHRHDREPADSVAGRSVRRSTCSARGTQRLGRQRLARRTAARRAFSQTSCVTQRHGGDRSSAGPHPDRIQCDQRAGGHRRPPAGPAGAASGPYTATFVPDLARCMRQKSAGVAVRCPAGEWFPRCPRSVPQRTTSRSLLP